MGRGESGDPSVSFYQMIICFYFIVANERRLYNAAPARGQATIGLPLVGGKFALRRSMSAVELHG